MDVNKFCKVKRNKMKFSMSKIYLVVLFSLCLTHFVESTKKLQIGIKKRAAKCTTKSKKGDFLHVHYKGTLENGEEFDNSYTRGRPLTFTLGSGQVVKGWDQGLIGMCVGEKRKLVIPPSLAYGVNGAPPKIPPNAVLAFEVELVNIERKNEL